jgi:hypothetical protein
VSFRSLLIDVAVVTRLTEDGFDDYGNVVADYVQVHAALPCRLDDRGGTETTLNQDSLDRSAVLFVEASAALTYLDRVEVSNELWEVTGQPVARRNSVEIHHQEVPLRRVVL